MFQATLARPEYYGRRRPDDAARIMRDAKRIKALEAKVDNLEQNPDEDEATYKRLHAVFQAGTPSVTALSRQFGWSRSYVRELHCSTAMDILDAQLEMLEKYLIDAQVGGSRPEPSRV